MWTIYTICLQLPRNQNLLIYCCNIFQLFTNVDLSSSLCLLECHLRQFSTFHFLRKLYTKYQPSRAGGQQCTPFSKLGTGLYSEKHGFPQPGQQFAQTSCTQGTMDTHTGIKVPLRGSVPQAETYQILSLAKNPR